MEMCHYPNRFLHPYTAESELDSHLPPSDTCPSDPQTHSESVLDERLVWPDGGS